MTVVSMTVNGKPVSLETEDRTLLVYFLREQMRLTGTHIGCDTTQCGACAVHVNGKVVKSCSVFAVQLVAPGDPLDGGDIGAGGLSRQHGAALGGIAVDVNDACAALAGVAADMGAGQAQILSQELHQKGAGIDIGSYGITVHDQGNFGHQHSLSCPRRRRPSAPPHIGRAGLEINRNP